MSGNQQLLLGQTGGAAGGPLNVENVYSTSVYVGNGGSQTITNGINLATSGGLVWIKNRTTVISNYLFDTLRGANNRLESNTTGAQVTATTTLSSFNIDGFSLNGGATGTNQTSANLVAWNMRVAPKFFDVVTYTGNGATTNTIPHNLGSLPGWIVAKRINAASDWNAVTRYTDANYVGGNIGTPWSWESRNIASAGIDPANRQITTTTFNPTFLNGTFPSGDPSAANVNGAPYVAYVFAQNAGGFGPLGTDSIIFCGRFSTTGQVNIGFEPQYIFTKSMDNTSSFTGDWRIFDTMRGIILDKDDAQLFASTDRAEDSGTFAFAYAVNATGFVVEGQGVYGEMVFMAIRRGPMAVPTVGTSVYSQVFYTGNSASNRAFTTGFPVDSTIIKGVDNGPNPACIGLRKTDGMGEVSVTGNPYQLLTDWTGYDNNTQLVLTQAYTYSNSSGTNYLAQSFGRAPQFHDVQTWTGTGSNFTLKHNLTVVPELVVIKNRTNNSDWITYTGPTGSGQVLRLNTTAAQATSSLFQFGDPTSTDFYVSGDASVNQAGSQMQAWMFGNCPGVSRVFFYTGNGSARTINCGFTTGARFVMIKRVDSTGGWYVFSTAMGMSSGSSPYFFMNTDANYVTGVDFVNTTGVGFNITSSAPSAINGSGGIFIFLAIA